jgi:hypothetical protein
VSVIIYNRSSNVVSVTIYYRSSNVVAVTINIPISTIATRSTEVPMYGHYNATSVDIVAIVVIGKLIVTDTTLLFL